MWPLFRARAASPVPRLEPDPLAVLQQDLDQRLAARKAARLQLSAAARQGVATKRREQRQRDPLLNEQGRV